MATTITLELPDDVYAAVGEAVSLGFASSRTAFFEEAIRLHLHEIRRARLEKLPNPAFRHGDKEKWPLYEED